MTFHIRCAGLCLSLFVALSATFSAAQTALDQYLGPLAGIVELGDDGLWNAQVQDGWFTLTNQNDPGAVTYYWTEPQAAQSGAYRLNLNLVVRGQGDGASYSGVLFNFRASDQYMGIVIGDDGGTYAIIRTPDGFNIQPVEGDGPGARGDGSDVLTAVVDGGTARFSLNGASLLEISNTQSFSPQLGIIAVGTGLFGYTNFDVSPGG